MIKEKLKRGTVLYKIYLIYHLFIRYKIFLRKRKSFSQFKEDIFINDFFKNQKIGKYVDLGAFHPMRLNNTYLLYKRGWSGTNIDQIQHRLICLIMLEKETLIFVHSLVMKME